MFFRAFLRRHACATPFGHPPRWTLISCPLVAFWAPRPPNAWVAGGGAPATHGTEWERLMYEKGYPTLSGDSRARRPTWARGGVLRVGPERVTKAVFFFFGPGPRGRAAQSAPRLSRLGSGKSVDICNFCTPRALRVLTPHIFFSSHCGSNEPSSGEIRSLIAEI